ncbi:MAG: hypothetical protein NC541_08690 [bacterium]|nr:hypothetical protein [bacterium]
MQERMKALREHLFAYKAREDKTNLEIALDCDLSTAEFDRIIYGKAKNIYLETALKIAEGTKTPLEDIFKDVKGGVLYA